MEEVSRRSWRPFRNATEKTAYATFSVLTVIEAVAPISWNSILRPDHDPDKRLFDLQTEKREVGAVDPGSPFDSGKTITWC